MEKSEVEAERMPDNRPVPDEAPQVLIDGREGRGSRDVLVRNPVHGGGPGGDRPGQGDEAVKDPILDAAPGQGDGTDLDDARRTRIEARRFRIEHDRVEGEEGRVV